jgi:hemerythrin-like metal-binding protein
MPAAPISSHRPRKSFLASIFSIFITTSKRRKNHTANLYWREEFSVGIIEIDSQHKHLLCLYNNLVDAVYTGQSTRSLGNCLDELLQYVVTHFTTEEQYMKKYGYPHYEIHKKEHDDLREKTYHIHLDFTRGQPVLNIEVLDFLKKWLANHVLISDQGYKSHLIARIPQHYLTLTAPRK